jgi:hypothetical protein
MKGIEGIPQSPRVVLPLLLWRRGLGRGGRSTRLPRWIGRAQGQALSCSNLRSPPKEERETAPRGRRACLGVWTLLSGQPGGLPEGSRCSPGGSWGRRPPGNRAEVVLHSGRGARAAARRGSVWHPSGVRGTKNTLSGGRSPSCPERPPATLCQPSGLASNNESGTE